MTTEDFYQKNIDIVKLKHRSLNQFLSVFSPVRPSFSLSQPRFISLVK